MVRHQLKEETFRRALVRAMKWLPFLIIYFGGISLNCAKAILCHALSINIERASTAKEPGPSGFFIGLDKMVQRFKWTWGICHQWLFLQVSDHIPPLTDVISDNTFTVMICFGIGAPWG